MHCHRENYGEEMWQPRCTRHGMERINQHAIRRLARGHYCTGKNLHRCAVAVILSVATALGAPQQTAYPPASAANPSKSADPMNRDSPQSSVFSFMEAYHARDYLRAARYLDLRKLPRNERTRDGAGLAKQLGQILDRDSQFEVANLSRDPEGNHTAGSPSPDLERVDTFKVDGRNFDLDVERLVLHSGAAIWVFSPDSLERLPELAQMTSDSPVERHLPPALVTWSFLDMSLWRWIALVVLAVLVMGMSRLITIFVLRLLKPLLARFAPHGKWGLLETLIGPLQVILASAACRAGVEWIDPSPRVRPFLERGLTLLFFLGLAWFCLRVVDLIMLRVAGILQPKHQAFSHSVLPLASRVVKITILLLMIAAVLSNWGYNTNTIVAGLGVGGIAIALAAQKTIENFFGGVAVVSDRPVAVGDFCKFGDRMGTVEDIGLRSTRIRTLDRTLVTVPNGQFSGMTLENFDRRDKMLFHLTLNLRRDTKPEQVRTLLASITGILTGHAKLETGPIPVRFVGVGTYSLDVEIFAYVLTRNGDEFMQIQQDLYLCILDAVETAGTALALPTQASISYSYEGTPQPPNGASQSREAILAGQRPVL